ncbi:uncharacterized protein LOC130807983 [Amaranthus tricolor]|uniref:uncharacterized protein LOC130807983 n=1 Tax=Amaranthus tricolor TaxID=29722 RepID=UPI002585BB33|nr:uncharacterized protein LOC130807983 [Amaranthus tricolor]
MSGIAVLLDLLRKNPNFSSTKTLHSFHSFSASAAVSGVAASVLAAYPFGYRAFLGSNDRIAYCDAITTWSEDHISKDHEIHKHHFESESLIHTEKVYDVELKPLFSAFHIRSFALTTLRSFLINYLPLLEPRQLSEEDDEDFLADKPEGKPVDLVAPFYNSLKQIMRECTVITTRRMLESLAVSYCSQRMAWKLLKDAPKSARRKAERGLPFTVYFTAVTKTTFRAHCLGVTASWVVQVGIDTYKTLLHLLNSKEDIEEVNTTEEFKLLCKKIYTASIKCTASLVFAAIGAGLGATLVHPSIGQWMGCAAGDLAGPVVVALCFDKFLLGDFNSPGFAP